MFRIRKKYGLISLIIIIIFLISGCSSTTSIDFGKQLTESFGIKVVVPEFEKYPITSVVLNYPPSFTNSNRYTADIIYSNKKGELNSNEELIENWEKQNEAKILYGPYEGGEAIIRMTIYNHQSSNFEGGETKIINGQEVSFITLDKEAGNFLIASFNMNTGGSYMLSFHLNDDFSIDDAYEFVDSLLNDLDVLIEE